MKSLPMKILILEDYPVDAELINLELRQANLEFESRRVETKDEFIKTLDNFFSGYNSR